MYDLPKNYKFIFSCVKVLEKKTNLPFPNYSSQVTEEKKSAHAGKQKKLVKKSFPIAFG